MIDATPRLTAALNALNTIPGEVAALPDVPMPTPLQRTITTQLTLASYRSTATRWATALGVAALVAVVLGLPLPPDDDASPPAEADPSASVPALVFPSEPTPTVALFSPELPAPPRRLPHRPKVYTRPPPSGGLSYGIIVRSEDCAGDLAVSQARMRQSEEHATTYKAPWICFNDNHQRRLERADAATWADFEHLLAHFERIEYRLDAWRGDPVMRTVLDDLFGAPTVTDHLAKDLHLEALAAEGLAREQERLVRAGLPVDPELVKAWAQRVQVLQSNLAGEAGERLDAHRPELRPELERLLQEATATRESVASLQFDGTSAPARRREGWRTP